MVSFRDGYKNKPPLNHSGGFKEKERNNMLLKSILKKFKRIRRSLFKYVRGDPNCKTFGSNGTQLKNYDQITFRVIK